VMAMRRFKESINPTYSFGKRSSSSGDTEIVSQLQFMFLGRFVQGLTAAAARRWDPTA
jgi:hypothetical protein